MCGLTGLWGPPRPVEDARRLVTTMRDRLRPRGPDDEGLWGDAAAGLWLGHRRLAILDLSAEGHQPMVSASGRWVIAYNGEVYSFGAVRRELEERGEAPEWRGGSDTEVLLASIEAWGLDRALRRFVGMFAFALWDRRERELHLVRDRLGIKPMVYGRARGDLVFGSTLAPLRGHPGFDRSIDPSALTAFLRFNYVPAPHTIHPGARKVEPGCVATFRSPGAEPRIRRYWSAVEVLGGCRQDPLGDRREALEQLEEALKDAVRLRLVSDVPLGAFLSGGIDSSTVVALMQELSDRPVRTYSIGNERADYDEGRAAAAVAAHLGTDHTALTVSGREALAVVPRLAEMYDEPFADASQIPTYLVSKLARPDVTVSLSGDGGDELFGGYNRHLWAPRVWAAVGKLPRGVRRLVSQAARRGDAEKLNRLLEGRVPVRLPGDKLDKLARVLPAASDDELYRTLQSQWDRPSELVVGGVQEAERAADGRVPARWSFSERMMLGDLLGYLPDDILTKVDRASMAVSLEARVPLLDHRVVELAWRMPMEQKIEDGVGKAPLRALLGRRVPAELWDRPKMGFGVPVGDWLRGPLRGWAQDLLSPERLRRQGLLRSEPIQRAWDGHLAGRSASQHALWGVLTFQAWYEATLEGHA